MQTIAAHLNNISKLINHQCRVNFRLEVIFGFVTDSFHIDWRSSINNTHRVISLMVYGFEDYGEKVF